MSPHAQRLLAFSIGSVLAVGLAAFAVPRMRSLSRWTRSVIRAEPSLPRDVARLAEEAPRRNERILAEL